MLPCNSRRRLSLDHPKIQWNPPLGHKPIVGYLGEHDRQVICHYVVVSLGGTYGDLVELDPLLGISFAVVGIDPKDLEACGPLYSS